VLQIYYFINQVFKSFCSLAGIIILAPGTSEVLVITSTPKKHPEEAERRLDPIDSSMRSHQDEGNSRIIDYLPD
jgi:hypothetical protein